MSRNIFLECSFRASLFLKIMFILPKSLCYLVVLLFIYSFYIIASHVDIISYRDLPYQNHLTIYILFYNIIYIIQYLTNPFRIRG